MDFQGKSMKHHETATILPWDFHGIPPGGGSPAVWAPGWAPGGATAARGTTGDGGDTKATGDPQFGDAGGGAWNADLFFFPGFYGYSENHLKPPSIKRFNIFILEFNIPCFCFFPLFGIVLKYSFFLVGDRCLAFNCKFEFLSASDRFMNGINQKNEKTCIIFCVRMCKIFY